MSLNSPGRPRRKSELLLVRLLLGLGLGAAAFGSAGFAQVAREPPPIPMDVSSVTLPDAPGFRPPDAPRQQGPGSAPSPCSADGAISPGGKAPTGRAAPPPLCVQANKFSSVIDADQDKYPALTSQQKGGLAVREVVDPFNLLTLSGQAALTVAVNSHTAYGPGFKGFGKLTGYALLGDATGAFFGVYAIPSIAHQDPRYHRMATSTIPRRILHAVAHTVIAESDDGHTMPNYATLGTYPITAEIANLYVPGVQGNGPSTVRRIGLAFATDPISNLLSEFLPDIARHIHLRSVFFQQIVNEIALGTGPGSAP